MEKHAAEHKKKMVAPIVITVLFLAYFVLFAVSVWTSSGWDPMLVLIALPLIALGVGMVYALKTRIKEIRSGEEDDLDNY